MLKIFQLQIVVAPLSPLFQKLKENVQRATALYKSSYNYFITEAKHFLLARSGEA